MDIPCEYCGHVHPVDPFYCIARLQDQLDQKDAEIEKLRNHILIIEPSHKRYEKVRKMTPVQFSRIWRWNLDGEDREWKTFDQLIDEWENDQLPKIKAEKEIENGRRANDEMV
jgi:hypothetical protein